MIKNCAPILIPTLNRFDHLEKCINSLLECKLCIYSDLYIALDYPLKDSHWEGYVRIQEFIKEIEGFKSVNVIKRDYNYGSYKNIRDSICFLFEKYTTVILTEDDNVFSNDFLVFMNKCLNVYKEDNSVFSVCGYNYPVKMPDTYKDEIYVWKGHSGWGSGFWRDKYFNVDWTEDGVHSKVKQFLKNYKGVIEFNEIANIYLPALVYMHNARSMHGDIYICMYQFLNNMYSVFPVVSRVRNLGNDGTGENCTWLEDDIYSKQDIYLGTVDYFISRDILPDREINNILKKHFYRSNKVKLRAYVKVILINIGLYKVYKAYKAKIGG